MGTPIYQLPSPARPAASAPAGNTPKRPRTLKDQTHTLRVAQWSIASAMVLGIVLFYALAYAPTQRRQAALKMQIESKQRELANSRDKARNLPILAGEVYHLQRKVERYDRQFPRQLELGPFIKDINRLCQQASLQDSRLQPGAPRRIDSLQEMPIVMHFNGDFLSVVSFLQQVEETLPRLTRVKRLKLKQRDAAGAVEVEAAVSIYFAEADPAPLN